MQPRIQLRRFALASGVAFGAFACGASPGSTNPAIPSTNESPRPMGMGGAGAAPSPPTTTTVPTPPKSGTGGALSGKSVPATWMAAVPAGGRGGAGGDALGGNVGSPKPVPGRSRNELGVDVAKPRPAHRTVDERKDFGSAR